MNAPQGLRDSLRPAGSTADRVKGHSCTAASESDLSHHLVLPCAFLGRKGLRRCVWEHRVCTACSSQEIDSKECLLLKYWFEHFYN